MPQIKQPSSGQLPQVKGPEFNDRDRVNDLLATEKYLTTGFNVATFEANDEELRKEFLDCLNESHSFQRQLFGAMFDRGWYKMETASVESVHKGVTDFGNYKRQLPYQTPPAH